jgi:DNA-directed RNA polymerase specialized sigma24 family protein
MTAKEFRRLAWFPESIERRKVRIAKLEKDQKENRRIFAAILRAKKTDAEENPDAESLNAEYDARAEQIRALKKANAEEQRLYDEGTRMIDACPDPRTRATLSAHYVEGLRYAEIVKEMEENGIFATETALRQAVNRWFQKKF